MTDLVQRVRAELERAEDEGRDRPGRPRLVRLTGATDHQIKMALAALADAGDVESPAVASLAPADRQPSPGGDEFSSTELVDAVADTEVSPVPAVAGDVLAMAGESLVVAGEGWRQRVARWAGRGTREVRTPGGDRHVSAGRPPSAWPLALIALGAAVAVWSGWVGLGELTGFGVVRLLPGLLDGLRLNTAVVLPLSVEAYGGFALRVWLGAAELSERTTKFARRSAVASLVIGAGAQVAYHLLVAAGVRAAPWPVVVLVACVPVVVLGLASALARLVTSDHQRITSGRQAGEVSR